MESQGMKNAKKMLEKLGWTEGSGLGLNNTGITEAIKPSAKFNLSGIGHKTYNDFQWWDHAFNKAAKAFDIKITDDQGAVVEKTQKMGKIKTKKGCDNLKEDSLAYGVFHKTGTLHNGVVEATETTFKLKEETDYSLKLSDEELFKVCNGLTAHKGARHGLTASGKLTRIAQQEAAMLANMMSNSTKNEEKSESTHNKMKTKKKKKKKSMDVETIQDKTQLVEETAESIFAQSEDVNLTKKSKKKKRSKKEMGYSIHLSENQEACDNEGKDITIETTIIEKIKKRKIKGSVKEIESESRHLLEEPEAKLEQSCDEPKKKKKKKKYNDS